MGAIDIGGLPRFGPQLSADLILEQDVFSGQVDVTHARGRHLLKAGGLVERYSATEFNPTFSRGVYRFASLQTFLAGNAASFIGLTPAGDVNRAWDWTLAGGYVQDDWSAARNVTVNAGLRVEAASVPVDPRDVNMPDLLAPAPTVGRLYQNPGATFSPRLGAAWNIGGGDRTTLRGGYGIYYTLNNQQDLIVTVTNPPATPRVVIANPSFPVPPFERAGGISVRPIQDDIDYPRVHVWNVNLQRTLWDGWVASVGVAGIARPASVAQRRRQRAGADDPRRRHAVLPGRPDAAEPAFLRHRAEVERRRFLVQGADPRSAPPVEPRAAGADVVHVVDVRGHDAERDVLLGLDDQLGVGDAGSDPRLQQGLLGLPRRAQLRRQRHLADPDAPRSRQRPRRHPQRLAGRGDRADAQRQPGHGIHPDEPLTLAVGAVARAGHRARSPELRASIAAPRTRSPATPTAGSIRRRSCCRRSARSATVGRNDLIGPDLRTTDLSFAKQIPWARLGQGGNVQLRVEIFNLFNRVNFGPPSLVAFSGTGTETAPLPSFGQIRTTITSARQAQIGVRVVF